MSSEGEWRVVDDERGLVLEPPANSGIEMVTVTDKRAAFDRIAEILNALSARSDAAPQALREAAQRVVDQMAIDEETEAFSTLLEEARDALVAALNQDGGQG